MWTFSCEHCDNCETFLSQMILNYTVTHVQMCTFLACFSLCFSFLLFLPWLVTSSLFLDRWCAPLPPLCCCCNHGDDDIITSVHVLMTQHLLIPYKVLEVKDLKISPPFGKATSKHTTQHLNNKWCVIPYTWNYRQVKWLANCSKYEIGEHLNWRFWVLHVKKSMPTA